MIKLVVAINDDIRTPRAACFLFTQNFLRIFPASFEQIFNPELLLARVGLKKIWTYTARKLSIDKILLMIHQA
ncbi:hypothetical protein ASE52_21105 [Acidovorax sp. Root275]|nr:hypothetical protein ASE52_21105 [Acidovorax sp. Root275]